MVNESEVGVPYKSEQIHGQSDHSVKTILITEK